MRHCNKCHKDKDAIDFRGQAKICNKCKEPKPVKDFTRDMTMADGRYNTCKTCINAMAQVRKAEQAHNDEELFNPNTPAF